MKIIIVHIGDILLCPPIQNLIKIIEDIGIECVVITTKSNFNNNKFQNIRIKTIDVNYEKDLTLLKKFFYIKFLHNKIWKILKNEYDDNALIWCSNNVSLKYLGNRILSTNYVLHLMELSENLRYYYNLPYLELNKEIIGNRALAVVVPEYNRAHIIKTWWNLQFLPLLFSNKPFIKKQLSKNIKITNNCASVIIEKLKNKKIILYQGILNDKERPLKKYIDAINYMGNNYAFVIMSNSKNIYEKVESENYYFIPYIESPKHLEITSHAYIGILSYFPSKQHYSDLNAVYCAPNKTFEYSMFGIPMIGNDVPGLKYVFEPNNAGVCLEEFTVENICKAIKYIESNYDEMSCGARRYYDSVDLKKEFINILDTVNRRKAKRM